MITRWEHINYYYWEFPRIPIHMNVSMAHTPLFKYIHMHAEPQHEQLHKTHTYDMLRYHYINFALRGNPF